MPQAARTHDPQAGLKAVAGRGGSAGPGWAPQGGHLQPSTKTTEPNQLGFFSDVETYSIEQSDKPDSSWALHEAQQNPQASDFQYNHNSRARKCTGRLPLWPPECPSPGPVSCQLCDCVQDAILSGPQCSHLSNGNKNNTHLTESA